MNKIVQRLFFSKFCFSDYVRLKFILLERGIDIVHIHGVWHPLFHWAAKAAQTQGIPYVIQPRGMLETWSMRFKRFKKLVALAVYQRNDLKMSSGFIATSDKEFAAIRVMGVNAPIAVIPNGVERPTEKKSRLIQSSVKTLLFMARIHPKKGVLELIRAWAKIDPAGWKLRIVGPDEGGHLKEVERTISLLKIDNTVEIVGPVYADERSSEFSNADLFILPTYSENFGIAVAEALSYGLPVITTTGAPWSSLVDYQCGWWVEPGEAALIAVLPVALGVSDEQRSKMSDRARSLAAKFDWQYVADRTLTFYSEVLTNHRNGENRT